ncbi:MULTISPECIES: YutD family protein [Paenibacillus]|uniref:Uncharacterized protein n=1 Tax=Paenibacillus naphthalenovorans TaxID=162209 RepID=A0A0U2L1X8_9BACL|nr:MULTISPECIES: YutD family protein [Paenibacillus]ALS23618.1 hypothetical protein IJ22_32570 [Paenibacillus naphthalenovorans]GCL73456.1 DUF1027 domain-containing protein [Paenibacillus naphthalenovorans]
MIHISGKTYEVIVDHKNGWRFEAFRDRYSEVLERYDYIVGDWGYNQLRLRGFFKDNHPKGSKDTIISTLPDYLNEYCNFGCAYFILEKVGNKQPQGHPGESVPESGIWQDGEPEKSKESETDEHKQRDQEQRPAGQALSQMKSPSEVQPWDASRRNNQPPNGKGQHPRSSKSGTSSRHFEGKQGGAPRGQYQANQAQPAQQQADFGSKPVHKQGKGYKSNQQQ